jgi:hypothetical protein
VITSTKIQIVDPARTATKTNTVDVAVHPVCAGAKSTLKHKEQLNF